MTTKARVLLAGVMTPALLLTQAGPSFADPGAVRFAQAAPDDRAQKPAARPPAPAAPPAPHIAPPAPHVAPVVPRAAPAAPRPAAAPAAPVVAPPAPHVAPVAPRVAPPAQRPAAAPPAPRIAPAAPSAAPAIPHAAPTAPRPTAAPAPLAAPKPPVGGAAPTAPGRPKAPSASQPQPQPHAAPSGVPAKPLVAPVAPAAPTAAPTTLPAPARPGAGAPANVGGAPTAHPPSGVPLRPNAVQPTQPAAAPLTGAPAVAPAQAPGLGAPAANQPIPRVPNAPVAAPPAPPPQPGASGRRISPAAAAALGAAAGAVGGFMLARPGAEPRSLEGLQRDRREFRDGDAFVYQEPGRMIVRDGDRYYLRHDENERFRALGGEVRSERRGDDFVTVYKRRDGDEIVTITDANGNLVRRYRRSPDGAEVVIIDNSYRGGPRSFADDVVVLPPPQIRIPEDRYIVDADGADERLIYETLIAPPVAPIPRRFTLDEIRSSPNVRAYTRSVDLDTVNFDTGSWALSPDQVQKLAVLAKALNQAIQRNANEVFLVEGHTDAVGTDVDNLSLSDRRAQTVAEILTRDFGVPPENLTTQGYGEQYLRVQTQGPERRNRRVTVRRITNLLTGQNQ